MKTNIKHWIILGWAMTVIFPVMADHPGNSAKKAGWYAGIQAGIPMGESEFSSFAADGFRAGWNIGINGGYRISSAFAFELSANYGQINLAEQSTYVDYNFFLGKDGIRYSVVPQGVEGYYYRDLQSRVFTQRYGLHANVNVLGFIEAIKNCRWRFELIPSIYAIGTSSKILSKADKNKFINNATKWHLGYGLNTQVMYALKDNIDIGIYGGFTQLNGDSIDGLPTKRSANYIAEVGVKATWNFGIGKKERPTPISNEDPSVNIPRRDTTNYKYKLFFEEAKKDIMRNTTVPWDEEISENTDEVASLVSTLNKKLELIKSNSARQIDKDIKKRYDELDLYKRCISTYHDCIKAFDTLSNDTTVKKCISEIDSQLNNIPNKEYPIYKGLEKYKERLSEYKNTCLYLAKFINTLNKELSDIRKVGNTGTAAINDFINKYEDTYDSFEDNLIPIRDIPALGELYDQYIDDLEANPIQHSTVEEVIANMLSLDLDEFKAGKAIIEIPEE